MIAGRKYIVKNN